MSKMSCMMSPPNHYEDRKAEACGYGLREDEICISGVVETVGGFVFVYCEKPDYTYMEFISGGRRYRWQWWRSFSRRYLVTLAWQMAFVLSRESD